MEIFHLSRTKEELSLKCFPTRKSTHSMRNCFFLCAQRRSSLKVIDRVHIHLLQIGNFFLIQRRIETSWDSGVVEFLTTIFLDNTCRDFYLHTANKQQHNTKLQLRTLCRARHQASWCAHQERRENITPFIIRHCVVCCLSGVVWDTFHRALWSSSEGWEEFARHRARQRTSSCDTGETCNAIERIAKKRSKLLVDHLTVSPSLDWCRRRVRLSSKLQTKR